MLRVEDRGIRIEYSVPSAAVDSGLEGDCYRGEFGEVDTRWQLANPDPEMVELYRQCLLDQGMAIPETADEMVRDLLDAGIDPGRCK